MNDSHFIYSLISLCASVRSVPSASLPTPYPEQHKKAHSHREDQRLNSIRGKGKEARQQEIARREDKRVQGRALGHTHHHAAHFAVEVPQQLIQSSCWPWRSIFRLHRFKQPL